jgi:hypothetical protein
VRNPIHILVVLAALFLVAGCDGRGSTTTPATTPTPTCRPGKGGGTVSPAIAICSITLVAQGGSEQIVRDGDTLHASPGDEVRIAEIAICVGPFSGNGGEACVDFVPVDQSGREIASERRGTHTQKVTAGCTSIRGPQDAWTVGESWQSISVVLNHWPPERTEDAACGDGLCEHDDRVTVNLERAAQ